MEILATVLVFVVLAMLVEFIVDVIKKVIPGDQLGQVPIPPLLSLVVGIVVAVMVQADIFAALGFHMQYAIAGWILTGIIISAGSKAVHELISKLRDSRGGYDNWKD